MRDDLLVELYFDPLFGIPSPAFKTFVSCPVNGLPSFELRRYDVSMDDFWNNPLFAFLSRSPSPSGGAGVLLARWVEQLKLC